MPKSSPNQFRQTNAGAPHVTIEVTEDLIESSERANSSHCMIAESIKKLLPRASKIMVDLQTIRWSDLDAKKRYVYLTPRTAQVALVQFDAGIHTEPFRFLLRNGQVINKAGSGRRKILTTVRGDGSVKVKGTTGGQAPKVGALASGTVRGARRTYGLRGLDIGR